MFFIFTLSFLSDKPYGENEYLLRKIRRKAHPAENGTKKQECKPQKHQPRTAVKQSRAVSSVAEVESSNKLLAEFAREQGSCVIVKGLRAVSDFENEFQMALINRKINPDLDTMFLTADSEYMYMSSSVVKELGSYGVEVEEFLPKEIIPDFQKKLGK